MTSHPNCQGPDGHVCHKPSGRTCVECTKPAGTLWGPHWCPEHDEQRLDRIKRQLNEIMRGFEND